MFPNQIYCIKNVVQLHSVSGCTFCSLPEQHDELLRLPEPAQWLQHSRLRRRQSQWHTETVKVSVVMMMIDGCLVSCKAALSADDWPACSARMFSVVSCGLSSSERSCLWIRPAALALERVSMEARSDTYALSLHRSHQMRKYQTSNQCSQILLELEIKSHFKNSLTKLSACVD